MSQDDVEENYFIDALLRGVRERGEVAIVYYRMFTGCCTIFRVLGYLIPNWNTGHILLNENAPKLVIE